MPGPGRPLAGMVAGYPPPAEVRRLTERVPTPVRSEPIANPITRSTPAVATFCDSGAAVLNGNSTMTIVASATIQVKNVVGRGVLSSSR